MVSSGPTTQRETLGKQAQTRWQEADPWGHHSGEEPTIDVKASSTRVIGPLGATKASLGAPTQPRESSYSLMVIVPMATMVCLLTVTAVAFCVWLLGWKVEKAKPLIKPQTNQEPTPPSPRPERSITLPTVTVMSLLKSSSSPPVSLSGPRNMSTRPLQSLSQWKNVLLGRHG